MAASDGSNLSAAIAFSRRLRRPVDFTLVSLAVYSARSVGQRRHTHARPVGPKLLRRLPAQPKDKMVAWHGVEVDLRMRVGPHSTFDLTVVARAKIVSHLGRGC